MGVPKNCRDLAPNLYKQCAASISQTRENKRDQSRGEKEGEERKTERVELEIKNIWELRVSPRDASEVKISPELRVQSKSSIRPDDSVNYTWSDYNR